MILTQLQQLIGNIYDVSITHDVYDFLVTDRRRLPACVRGRTSEEDLIVAQPAAAGGEDPKRKPYDDGDKHAACEELCCVREPVLDQCAVRLAELQRIA